MSEVIGNPFIKTALLAGIYEFCHKSIPEISDHKCNVDNFEGCVVKGAKCYWIKKALVTLNY